ncbi:MAG: PAS domain-containing protein [Candidatus Hydrogenedentota bacterium]
MADEEGNSHCDKPRYVAEARQDEPLSAAEDLSLDRVKEILHELLVKQTELGKENEALRAARDSLARARDRYQRLYDFAPAGYVSLDGAGLVKSVNRTFENMVHTERAHVIKRPFSMLLTPASRPGLPRLIQQATAKDRIAQGEVQLLRGGEKPIWVLLNIEAEEDVRRASQEVWVTVVDIDARKRAVEAGERSEALARERLAEIETIYRQAPVGLAVFDSEFRFVRVNARLAAINGLSVEEHLGRKAFELLPDLEVSAGTFFEQVLATGEPVENVEISGETPARPGETRHWIESFYPLKDSAGIVTGLNVVVQEITARKRAEETVQRMNEHLEETVAARTRELAAAYAALKQRAAQLQVLTFKLAQTEDRERRRLADLLHDDLQQLLVGARLHIEHMMGHLSKGGTEHEIAARVDQLVREAIGKARNLSHELSPPVLRNGTMCQAFEWLAGEFHEKHRLPVAFTCNAEEEPGSQEMKNFLFKAVRELLFNVIKHAHVHSAKLHVGQEGQEFVVVVSDEGCGFDPGKLDAAGMVQPGFGLLSIKERVAMHGGSFAIDSVPGDGARFTLRVPLDGKSEHPPTAPLPDAGTGPGKPEGEPLRVLLVDDHRVMREGLRTFLGNRPDIMVVGEADNGKQAVDQAARLMPDVVIMDVALPLMSGVEATRLIKEQWPAMRVVGLSMFDEPGTQKEMRAAGASMYLRKACHSDALIAAIRGEPHETD